MDEKMCDMIKCDVVMILKFCRVACDILNEIDEHLKSACVSDVMREMRSG